MNPSENIALVGFMASFVIFAMGNAPKNTFFETCPFIVSPCHFSLVFVLNENKLKFAKDFNACWSFCFCQLSPYQLWNLINKWYVNEKKKNAPNKINFYADYDIIKTHVMCCLARCWEWGPLGVVRALANVSCNNHFFHLVKKRLNKRYPFFLTSQKSSNKEYHDVKNLPNKKKISHQRTPAGSSLLILSLVSSFSARVRHQWTRHLFVPLRAFFREISILYMIYRV